MKKHHRIIKQATKGSFGIPRYHMKNFQDTRFDNSFIFSRYFFLFHNYYFLDGDLKL